LVNLFTSLGKKMALAGKAGTAGTYNSWMFEESDLKIQHCGKSFGEGRMADRFTLTLET
jgi:hypothetical protein